MESSSEGGRIQISEACKNLLPTPYQTEKRGTVAVKGKGAARNHHTLCAHITSMGRSFYNILTLKFRGDGHFLVAGTRSSSPIIQGKLKIV